VGLQEHRPSQGQAGAAEEEIEARHLTWANWCHYGPRGFLPFAQNTLIWCMPCVPWPRSLSALFLRCAGVVPPTRPGLWTKGGHGVARSAGAADDVAAIATRPAARGNRGADAPGAADRAAVESPGGAVASRRPPADLPRGSASARPRRWPPSSTTHIASRLLKWSAGTSAWSPARTSRATRMGWGTSRARGRRWSANWWPTVREYFERIRRDDPQRKKIALVAT